MEGSTVGGGNLRRYDVRREVWQIQDEVEDRIKLREKLALRITVKSEKHLEIYCTGD